MKLLIKDRCSDAFSLVGANPTLSGTTTYAACKFGNGQDFNTNGTRGYGAVALSTTNFSMGFWAKMGVASSNSNIKLAFNYYPTLGFEYWFKSGYAQINVLEGGTYKLRYKFATTYSAGDVIHWGHAFNMADTGHKARFYQNNVETAPDTVTTDTGWSGTNFDIRFNEPSSSSFYFNAIVDAVSIYDGVKTDWADEMNNERAGLNDQVIIM